jgi:hypothetical protein
MQVLIVVKASTMMSPSVNRHDDMSLDQLNKWLSLAANIGIIASIVFLAAQVSQNSQMMEVQALTTNAAAHVQSDLAMVGENPIGALTKVFGATERLSDEELGIVSAWFSANSWQFRNSFDLYELGVISEEGWQTELNLLSGYYGSPLGLAYWDATKPLYRRAYVQSVESVLTRSPDASTTWFQRLREGARAIEADRVSDGL